MTALVSHPCRSMCWWAATGELHHDPQGDLPLFACAGCGSQWVRTEPWTPRQLDGSWPDGVREELARRQEQPQGGAPGPAGQ